MTQARKDLYRADLVPKTKDEMTLGAWPSAKANAASRRNARTARSLRQIAPVVLNWVR